MKIQIHDENERRKNGNRGNKLNEILILKISESIFLLITINCGEQLMW